MVTAYCYNHDLVFFEFSMHTVHIYTSGTWRRTIFVWRNLYHPLLHRHVIGAFWDFYENKT